MVTVEVKCPVCNSNKIVKFGLNPKGKQRYQCLASEAI